MSAYQDYYVGKLVDHNFTDEELYAKLNELNTLSQHNRKGKQLIDYLNLIR